jgi:hypothetical protein
VIGANSRVGAFDAPGVCGSGVAAGTNQRSLCESEIGLSPSLAAILAWRLPKTFNGTSFGIAIDNSPSSPSARAE